MQVHKDGIEVDALKAAKTEVDKQTVARNLFHVEDMFETFCKTIKMDPRKMPTHQLAGLKKFFIAGVGHILILSHMQLYDNFNEVEANDILDDVLKQCNDYLAAHTSLSKPQNHVKKS